ncbi:MAG: hypothetical protein GY794_15660, partial [bacterium]|nr:hypothetical protein [bacterium]
VDDINGDFISDVLIGAPGADPDATLIDAGQAYLVFGTDQGFDATFDLNNLDGKNGFALDGATAGDTVGYAVAGAGDLNSDGVGDVVVGAPGADPNGDGSGAAYVFFGATDFAVAQGLSGLFYDTDPIITLIDAQTALTTTLPEATFLAYQIDYPNSDDADSVDGTTSLTDFLGLNAEDIVGGDTSTIDGSVFTFDGYLHVAEAGTYTFEVGAAEGYSLSIDGATVVEQDGTPGFTKATGLHTFTTAGFYDISLLYYTDDTPSGIELKSDLVTTDGTLDFVSREQLFTAPPTAAFDLGTLDGYTGFALVGAATGDALGTAVGQAGDLNEDGASDLIVGAPGADANGLDSGQAYVVFGETLTTIDEGFAPVIQITDLDGTVGFRLDGAIAGAQTGTAVGTAGDLNDDGVDDLLIGTLGTAHIVFGDTDLGGTGLVDLSTLDGVTGFTTTTAATDDQLGRAVAFIGDVDGDGVDDIALGASGAGYVLLGRQIGGATTTVQYAMPTSAFIIDGGDANANITFGGPQTPGPLTTTSSNIINFNGVSIEASGDDVTVGAGVTISTRQIDDSTDYANALSTGDSGDITLISTKKFLGSKGGAVTIEDGASLFAHVEGGSSFAAGDVTIKAKSTVDSLSFLSINIISEGSYTSTVKINDGVTILGGEIKIESKAGITSINEGMSAVASGIASASFGLLKSVTGLLDLPLAVQVSLVEATVEIGKEGGDNVVIQGSGKVSIGAEARAEAKGDATSWLFPKRIGTQFSVGVWVAESTSRITLHDNVTVQSIEKDVKIEAVSETEAGGAARVSQNLDAGLDKKAPANPNNRSLAIGIASTTMTSNVTVKEGASVIADVGNVTITSEGEEDVRVSPQTRSYKDGQFGLALALEFATADIRTVIQGEVFAGGAEEGREITFDPFLALDTNADTIDIGVGHGYETGDKVIYSPELGGSIDGLERFATYYVIVDDNNLSLIQLAASEDDALEGITIDLLDNPTLTSIDSGHSLAFSQVGDASDWIDYGFAHGFTAGEALVYTAAEGKRVGGLVDGQTYYVVLVEGDENGSLVRLASNPDGTGIADLDTNPTFTVQATGQELTVASVEEGPSVITFTEAHGLSAGDAIVFHPALGLQLIDPLTEERYADGTIFYAIPNPSANDPTVFDPTQIRLSLTEDGAVSSNRFSNTVALQIDGTLMLGTDHVFTPKSTNGITATATMTGMHRLETKSRIGGKESKLKTWSRPEFVGKRLSNFLGNSLSLINNPQLKDVKNNAGPMGNNADTSDKTFEFAAAMGYLQVHRTVETVIGSTAVLKSGGDIDISASATETGNVIIEAGLSEAEKRNVKVGGGVSIAVDTDESTVLVVVNDGP